LTDRVSIWQELKDKENKITEKFPQEKITITMPDKSTREGVSWKTSPFDVAMEISKGLANATVLAKVKYTKRVATLDDGLFNPEAGEDGKEENDGSSDWWQWDVNRPLEGDCDLILVKFDDPLGKEVFWHSSAHILGQSLENEYGVKLCIGPPTANGFYYDAYCGKDMIKEDHYKQIESVASKICDSKQTFERLVLTKTEALRLFGDNPFKIQLISNKIPDGGKCTAYRCGTLIDLCTGPHIPSSGMIKAF
jgi:threonyl-tRNA synthetase